jgi:hypothetical protein
MGEAKLPTFGLPHFFSVGQHCYLSSLSKHWSLCSEGTTDETRQHMAKPR